MIEFITPLSYWILTALWMTILTLYLFKLRASKVLGGTVSILVTLLAIDAFRTLFESIYFGFYFNSMFGLLPQWIYEFLSQPVLLIIPKLVNIFAGLLVLILLVGRWLPREALARKALAKNLEKTSFLASRRHAEFKAIFNSITDAIVFADPDRRIAMVNPAFTSTFGFQFDEVIGQSTEIIYADSKNFIKQGEIHFNPKINMEDDLFLNEYRRKDGTVFSGETLGTKVVDAHGRHLGYVGVIRDVTNREQARKELSEKIVALETSQKELTESQQRFSALLEASYSGVIIHQNAMIQDCNSGLSKILGYSREELIGTSVFQLMTPDSRRIAEDKVWTESYDRFEVTAVRKDGSIFPLAIRGRKLTIGGIPARVIEFRDISEEKEMKDAQCRLNEELREKVKELEEIVYVASHDLRSPLVTIEGFSGILSESLNEIHSTIEKENLTPQTQAWLTPFFEDSQKSINFIRTAASNMSSLLHGVLNISRLSHIEVRRENIDMNVLLKRVLADFKYQVESNNIKINVTELPGYKGDREQIAQVFSNLVENAMKYAHPDRPGVINISAEQKRDRTVYCIADNGQGIAPEHQERIFDLFNQLNKSNDGQGLGLSIVRKIVDRHKGKIWVESEVDQGSKFYISL